jgi:hypothetical protein
MFDPAHLSLAISWGEIAVEKISMEYMGLFTILSALKLGVQADTGDFLNFCWKPSITC